MILLSVLPLLRDNAMTRLLQTLSSIIVGTIRIQITNDEDEQRTIAQVSF